MLPYGRQSIDDDDVAAVERVLRGDWLTTGPSVNAFEKAVAKKAGATHGVAVASGTAALHAAAYAAGIGTGHEVIVPAITFAATANCVLYCDGHPVFADVERDTLNIDVESVEAHITEHTKAIIAVNFAGQPADWDALHAIADEHNLILIDDAAHALGATYRDRPVGSLAHLTCFSTHPVKPITSGEGGVVVTDDDRMLHVLRAFRNHGIAIDAKTRAERGDWVYEMDFLGYNYRLPDVLCALGLSQIEKLDAFNARRTEIAARYDEAFVELEAVSPLAQIDGRQSAWHLYVIRLELEKLTAYRRQIFQALRAEGIGVNVHYIPVYYHPYYERRGYSRGLCPNAEAAYERILTLPLWPGMGDDDVDDVITAVRKVVGAYAKDGA